MFEDLFGKRANHITPGLERIRRAYEYLGQPARQTACILVGGTNGKGTTAAFIWQLLTQLGLRCGLYTSPHLQHFCERYSVSGDEVSDEQVAEYWQGLKSDLPADLYDELSFFEVATLIAFRLFDERQTTFNIYEVGLGGRLDATNIVEPVLSVITSIGIDHRQYLGNTVQAIAFEKAGIMREGRTVLLGRMTPEASAVLHREALQKGADAISLNQIPGVELNLEVVSGPTHLRHNFALALAAVKRLNTELTWGHELSKLDLGAAFSVLKRLPAVRGRYERMMVGTGQQLIFDVAHNPDGVTALAAQVLNEYPDKTLPAFVSIFADKDVAEMLDLLRSIFSPVVLFRIKNERSFLREELPLRHQSQSFHSSFEDAWKACKDVWPMDVPWVVCGSLAAVGDVFDYFGVELSKAKSNSGV